MNTTYRATVTIQAPAGTHHILSTLDGWESQGGGVYVVTDPDWRADVEAAFGAEILAVKIEAE